MKFIGITGGVGAGKSTVLGLLKENYNCKILLADQVAAELMSSGHECFDMVVGLDWGQSILGDDGEIDRPLMARLMYSNENLRKSVNEIVHPAVEREVLNQVEIERENHNIEYFFFEAALLLECGYDKLCDEIWFIFARPEIRRERLKLSRGYSDEKISSMMDSQLSDSEFESRCQFVVDNSASGEETLRQIKEYLNSKN